MPAEFRYRRRVHFAETDMVGIAHFSCYFRYMEEAEHALWRSLGLAIAPPEGRLGYPRVAASCEFKAPLRFEDEVDVHVRVEAVGRRSIRYGFSLRRGDDLIATGTMTSVCVETGPDAVARAVDLPEGVAALLR